MGEGTGCLTEILIYLGLYLYVSFCLFQIANKTGVDLPYLAFVPVANVFVFVNASGRSLLWAILMFLPVVNLFAAAMVGMGIAECRGKPAWMGVFFGIPVVNLFAFGYFAFFDGFGFASGAVASTARIEEPQSVKPAIDTSPLRIQRETCKRCGRQFVPYQTDWSRAGFCSRNCYVNLKE